MKETSKKPSKKLSALLSRYDYHDPEGRKRLFRILWFISTFMLILGWILIIFFILR